MMGLVLASLCVAAGAQEVTTGTSDDSGSATSAAQPELVPTASLVRAQVLWDTEQLGTAMGRPALYNGLVFVQCAASLTICCICV